MQKLLQCFVNQGRRIYDNHFLVYNVHTLLHLSDIASSQGSLQECTAYKFENNMTKIKNCIRGTGDPVTQIANRMAEMTACQSRVYATKAQKPSIVKVKANKCFKLQNGRFCIVHSIHRDGNLCEVFGKTEPYFIKPCDSRIVGIHKARRQTADNLKVDDTDITD